MKRILSVFFILSVLIGIFSFSVSAKSVSDVVNGVMREQVVLDDMYTLCEAVDENDAANIFQTVLVVYPDLIAAIKKNMEDDYVAPAPSGNVTAGAGDKRYVYAVTELIKSPVVLEDLEKLTETVSAGNGGEIFECILVIYPDFVTTLKRALAEYPRNDSVPFSFGNPMETEDEDNGSDTVLWVICAGVGGIAVGAVSVYVIMNVVIKNKKKTIPDSRGESDR